MDNINAAVNDIISVRNDTWTSSNTSSFTRAYQRKRDGSNISGATSQEYTITADDLLTVHAVDVTASNAAGSSTPATDDVFIGPNYAAAIRNLDPITWWPLSEASGTTVRDRSGNGRNGTASGVAWGGTGIGDGLTAPSFDGVNDFATVHSSSFASAFNGAEGTLLLWARVSGAGVWSDGATRNLCNFYVDASNEVAIQKTPTANTLQFRYRSGGTFKGFNFTTSAPTGWFPIVLTWSAVANQFRAFVSNTQAGTTQTGLGTWSGTLAATTTVLGALSTSGTNPWSGLLAHAAIWNRVLTSGEIDTVSTVV